MECSMFVRKVMEGLPCEGRLLVCVSGGADSMALLHACVRADIECIVVHCDFHLRGDESERDRRFVEWVCRQKGIPCKTVHFDVPTYMEKHGVSLEMACRDLRYATFRQLKDELGCVRIVTAHNSSDNDETMLLNLFRGTGVRGLCGMEADNGEIARPLLRITREEIERFLAALNVRYITDSSNLTSDFRRNFIRRELLPAIEKRWPGVRKALDRTRKNLKECDTLCKSSIATALPADKKLLPYETLKSFPSAGILLHAFLKDYGASPSQIDEIAAGIRPGCRWLLKRASIYMDKQGIHAYPLSNEKEDNSLRISIEKIKLTAALMTQIKENKDKLILYYSTQESLKFRQPRRGDRISPIGMNGSKLVSDLLHEAEIPLPFRSLYPLLEDSSGRVIWIPGIRRSRLYTVQLHTHEYVYKMRVDMSDLESLGLKYQDPKND